MRSAIAFLLALLLAACGERDEAAAPQPEAPPPLRFEQASTDPLRHGERLARVLGCRGCHGDDLTGHAWIEDPDVALLYTSNLTRAVPRYTDAQLDRLLREGVRPDGSELWAMPSELFAHLDGSDMAALIAWLRTVAPAGRDHPPIAIGPQGRRDIEAGRIPTTPQEVRRTRSIVSPPLDGRHEWARYMIRATCSECHGMDLRGRVAEEGPGAPPDLAVAGAYSRDQFRHLMRTGEPPGGRDLGLMRQVSRGRFAYFTAPEVDAIYDYLAARAAAAAQ